MLLSIVNMYALFVCCVEKEKYLKALAPGMFL
jgi:hypothetical protein